MIDGPPQSGRTRLVITVVLAVLIGAVGAFLLPILIHEADPPAPTGFRAEIGFLVPDGGLPRGGAFRVAASHPEGGRLDVEEGIPASATGEAVIGLLLDGLGAGAWPEDAAPTATGGLLSFPLVTRIAGAPGDTGIPMTISAASRPGMALDVRLAATPLETGVEGSGRVRAALSAREVVPEDGSTSGVVFDTSTGWLAPEAVGRALVQRLHDAGWVLARMQEPGVALVRMPDGSEPGSILLTVEHEGEVRPMIVWSLARRP